jgi:hypothetical protein
LILSLLGGRTQQILLKHATTHPISALVRVVAKVFFKVVMGYRPPIPTGMPDGYKELMTACWHADPAQRPPFEDIVTYLRRLYHSSSDGAHDARRSLDLNPWG